MLKVFLVEDESIIRDGLRDNMPWEEFGYQFVGDASDGEMALPLIRKTKPDVLITDIKMPFMDGLSLSRIVTKELPGTKIIIISGYDEFDYAQQAIRVGVEQYLLKPITRNALKKALLETREKIESEQEQKDYMDKFKNELHEYEQYSRRIFLEKLFNGKFSVHQIYEEADKLSLDLNGPCYNVLMLSLQEVKSERGGAFSDSGTDIVDQVQEELMRYLMRFPEYIAFRWNVNMYGILIQSEESEMDMLVNRCVEQAAEICKGAGSALDWHLAVGTAVNRLSQLPDCFTKVNHIQAYRFLIPNRRILNEKEVEGLMPGGESRDIDRLDIAKVDPEIIRNILAEGSPSEIHDFVSGYLLGLKEALNSKLFRDYLLLSVRFTTLAFVQTQGYSKDEFLATLGEDRMAQASVSVDEIQNYMEDLLRGAVELRNQENDNQSKRILKKAMDYLEVHYKDESLSLNAVSSEIGVSPSYFSGIFSQEMQTTFIEYVTKKRMETAKKLLKQSELHTGEIAAEVGYKDSHYFSFVFKKTQGCTPREYRNRKL